MGNSWSDGFEKCIGRFCARVFAQRSIDTFLKPKENEVHALDAARSLAGMINVSNRAVSGVAGAPLRAAVNSSLFDAAYGHAQRMFLEGYKVSYTQEGCIMVLSAASGSDLGARVIEWPKIVQKAMQIVEEHPSPQHTMMNFIQGLAKKPGDTVIGQIVSRIDELQSIGRDEQAERLFGVLTGIEFDSQLLLEEFMRTHGPEAPSGDFEDLVVRRVAGRLAQKPKWLPQAELV